LSAGSGRGARLPQTTVWFRGANISQLKLKARLRKEDRGGKSWYFDLLDFEKIRRKRKKRFKAELLLITRSDNCRRLIAPQHGSGINFH